MTYRQAQKLLEQTSSIYRKNIVETMVQRLVYWGTIDEYSECEYYRKWDDEITEADKVILRKKHRILKVAFDKEDVKEEDK